MKIKRKIIYLLCAITLFYSIQVEARENGANGGRRSDPSTQRLSTQDQLAATCTPAAAKTDLDINNVRTTIMTGGDMWWDLTNPKYEVPKDGNAHSIFSGALWIGGLDAGGQLKVAGMTYRQTGNDFWPGPLDTTTVSIDGTTCQAYDKHWKITRAQVQEFSDWFEDNNTNLSYSVPLVIQTWPGNGDPSLGQGRYLAPFVDRDGDGYYNWAAGDYPAFDISGNLGCSKFQVFGDQCLWWVFNDKGNIHSETGAAPIGLEIHAQAFAFATNDEINNMTFYNYKIINRSTISMGSTYFGQWTDADLGDAFDDYVGCDVTRGLGYTYNGTANDGGNALPSLGNYGANPPAIGTDFFEGPLADPGDGIDNDRDGILDEVGEQIIMSKFVYYENDFSVRGNPENASHFYGYLSGFWKDGTPFTYGGNAYGGTVLCNFMFPGDTDPTTGPPWDEYIAGNPVGDRRMIQSAGPFTLQPGAVNYITVGAVWARAAGGGPQASVELMRTTDDKAQRLFNNCFRTLDGPDAPDITIQELDKELILYLTNKVSSNNYLERYEAYDPGIVYASLIDPPSGAGVDTTYNFEGYQIFQLKDATTTTADLYNPDKARLVAQFDKNNDVMNLVNRDFDAALNADVPKDMTIEAKDEGIEHSLQIYDDAFAIGDRRLINHKTYYYMVISYAYNSYLEYDDVSFDALNPAVPSNIGQKKPYLAGRRNVKIYKGIPHIPSPELGGTIQASSYAAGPKLTRQEGSGNGGNVLDLTQSSIDQIVNAPPIYFDPAQTNNLLAWINTARINNVTYENGRGPVNIKVIDPLNVPSGDFELRFTDNLDTALNISTSAHWVLNQLTPETRSWDSDTTITLKTSFANEQIIPEIGLSVTIAQVVPPGLNKAPNNGMLESSITFTDPLVRWLTGVEDDDSQSDENWIRAGTFTSTGAPCGGYFNDWPSGANWLDADGIYENVVDGTWAPYRLTAVIPNSTQAACYTAGVAYNDLATSGQNKIENIPSVDVVFTNDRSKWTRVPVFEVGTNASQTQGAAVPMALRAHASVDKSGRTSADAGYNAAEGDLVSTTGMGWFPGYAINIETGERLNMAFGENSALVNERGRDMLWNPTATDRENFLNTAVFGGQHNIYVFAHNSNFRYTTGALTGSLRAMPAYDMGAAAMRLMTTPAVVADRSYIWRDAVWASIPMLHEDYASWNFNYAGGTVLPCDVKVRLRVSRPYRRMLTGVAVAANLGPNDSLAAPQNGNNPFYTFNTDELKVTTADANAAKDALELINVVPNPYYAYSGYETSQLDNRVKFTNLPVKCLIRVYTVNGTLVRRMTKDSPQTSLDWDLKNQAGIPVASGMYIIHVEATDGNGIVYGEKILKWFGVLRPIDLDAY